MKKIYFFLLLFACAREALAQSPLTSGFFNYHLTDRYEILSDSITPDFFTGVKPYRRDALAAFSKKIKPSSKVDEFNKDYLLRDNILFSHLSHSRKPILKNFYKTENALLLVKEDRFKVVLNPVLGFMGASDPYDSLGPYRNSRGVELRGNVGNKIGFYSYALENQARFPDFLREKHDKYNGVNGATQAKIYANSAKDFFNVAGHITVSPIEEVMVQLGHDKNFIGNGYRSIILADQTAPYTFVKLNTKVWKINYMNLYSVHRDNMGFIADSVSARKFSALHHFSINITKNLTLGLFENIIFDRQDPSESGNFEIDYINPLIFYRALEQGLNSTDNSVLGADIKWNFQKRYSFYGQLIFDEFRKKEFFAGKQAWVNKWGYQVGIKYINVANINNLDLQIEVNQIRPFVYQHLTRSQNWIHYNQSLAHPLGANFKETILVLRYQPISRLNLKATYSYSTQGLDSSYTSTNFGGDVTRAYIIPADGPTVPMFQGIKNQVSALSLNASYMLWHNLFLDAGIFIRNQQNSLLKTNRNNVIFSFGMRLNLAQTDYRQ